MIATFRHKGLKRLYENGGRRRLPPDTVERVEDILALLDVATPPANLNRPAFRLHALKGDPRGFRAVTVRAIWRIIVRCEGGNACDVDFIDYHQQNHHGYEDSPIPAACFERMLKPSN